MEAGLLPVCMYAIQQDSKGNCTAVGNAKVFITVGVYSLGLRPTPGHAHETQTLIREAGTMNECYAPP